MTDPKLEALINLALTSLLSRYDEEPDTSCPLDQLLPDVDLETDEGETRHAVEMGLRELQVFGVRTLGGNWLLTDDGAVYARGRASDPRKILRQQLRTALEALEVAQANTEQRLEGFKSKEGERVELSTLLEVAIGQALRQMRGELLQQLKPIHVALHAFLSVGEGSS